MQGFKNPRDVVKTFVDGWNEKDAEKLASIFVEDSEFVNVAGLWWHTKERIYKAHEYGLRVIFKDSPLKILYQRARQLTSDVTIVHVKMKLENQTPFMGGVKNS